MKTQCWQDRAMLLCCGVLLLVCPASGDSSKPSVYLPEDVYDTTVHSDEALVNVRVAVNRWPDCTTLESAIQDIFRLEGYYDRQMRDGKPRTPPEFALRDRLRFWFQNREMARAGYARLGIDASKACDGCDGGCGTCPYGLDVRFKLRYAHYKLAGDVEVFQ